MLEVQLELKLNAFLINSTGDSGGLANQLSTRTLKFSCEKILSARQLTDSKPTSDFEFLGAASAAGSTVETDASFDEQFVNYLSSRTQITDSKLAIASGEAGYCVNPREGSNGEIGRLFLKEQAGQSSVNVELVLKQNEFDAIWDLTTKQNVQKMIGAFVCFKPKHHVADGSEVKNAAGILTSTLQILPGA